MRTIAIINQKGGCGKTTLSINLAAVLAQQNRKTLLIDMDPQSHCALGLAVPESQIDKSIGDMLRSGLDGSIAFNDITWQISRSLDLAPSTMALAAIEQELSTAPDKDRRLAQVVSTVADLYEFCIIDCPPSIGLLTFNALRAADEVLIPVETGYFSLQGAIKQEATIQMLARRAGHRVRFKVLPTMYDVRTKLAREILSELRRHFGDRLLPVVINFNSKLKEAASFGQPITEYDTASKGMQDFEKLVDWLIANPPATATDEPGGTPATNPAMTRAAELVERARALSARTAALAAKLSTDPDIAAERRLAAATDSQIIEIDPIYDEPDPQPEAATASASAQPTTAVSPAAPQQASEPAPRPTLDQKLARLYGVRATSQGLLFVQPVGEATHVSIAGDFNGWNPALSPLRRDNDLGVWQACFPVPPGRYRYRLVLDGKWVQDPYNTYVESNPFGELNNVVEFGV